jgi:hypothetical protein
MAGRDLSQRTWWEVRYERHGSNLCSEPLVGEHERIVSKLNGRQVLRGYHHLERFNALNYRGARALVLEAAQTPKAVAVIAAATANSLILCI